MPARKKTASPSVATRRDSPIAVRPAKRGAGWWLVPAALLIAVWVAYLPAAHGGLLWDDDQHVISKALQSSEGLRRIWVEVGATQQYYPVVYSAFWLQHRLWGDDTRGYHAVNVALHACTAFLLGLLLRRLAVPGAWLAAVIFALHPVHVESVAWISELKNTLSGAFYFGAALAYLRFDETRRARAYGLALALFVLALSSKTVTATLPAALLVVFWWQRNRIEWRRDVLPLVPLFVTGAAGGLTTAWIERTLLGARGADYDFTIVERCLIAGRAFWFYLQKLFWPADLIFVYPRWDVSQSVWWQYLYPVAAFVLVAIAWAVRRRTRAPLAALLVFLGTLFPVLGFFNVYPFRFSFVADHFQYLASASIITLFASALVRLADWRGVSRATATMTAALVVGSPLAVQTWHQSAKYADALTLYRATLEANPSCWLAHINRGILVVDERPDEAEADFLAALRLKPDLPEAHYNLGIIAHRRGRLEDASRFYKEALRHSPVLGEARNNLSDVLRRLGRLDEAAREGEAAIRVSPKLPEAHYSLGVTLQELGRLDEAAGQYEEALRLGLDEAEAHYRLASVLHQLGRYREATTHYDAALRERPAYPEALINLGDLLLKTGRPDEAVARYREAIRLKPDYADAYYYLGNALQGMGRFEEAVAQYAMALQYNPRDGAVHNNLGVALEALGRLREAAAEYAAAVELRPDLPGTRDNLARVTAARR